MGIASGLSDDEDRWTRPSEVLLMQLVGLARVDEAPTG